MTNDVEPGDTVWVVRKRGRSRSFHILGVSRPFPIFDFGGTAFGYWTDDVNRVMIEVPLRVIEKR